MRAYECLALRVVRDLRLTPLVFDVLQLRMSSDEAVHFLERLDAIHTTLAPATENPDDEGDA